MAYHAKLSPSSAVRWLNCPASVVMSEGREDKITAYGAEGTAAHFLAEVCLKDNTEATYHVGKTIEIDSNGDALFIRWSGKEDSFMFDIDAEMAEHVQTYINNVRALAESSSGELLIEQKLKLEDITGEKDATGTGDAVIIADEEIIICDLKYGRGNRVHAERNYQLMIYGLAALLEYEVLRDFKRVRLIVDQPRLNHVSEWVISVEDLREFHSFATPKAELALSLDDNSDLCGLFNPSADACRWCRAKDVCKPLADHVAKSVSSHFDDLSESLTVDTAKFDNDMLAKLYSDIPLFKKFIEMLEAKTESVLLKGGHVPGLKVVMGKSGKRRWVDEVEAEAALEKMRLKKDERYKLKVISPTDAEKLHKSGSLGKRQWNKLQDLIIRPSPNPVVTSVEDKRPAIEITPVEEQFNDLDDEHDGSDLI